MNERSRAAGVSRRGFLTAAGAAAAVAGLDAARALGAGRDRARGRRWPAGDARLARRIALTGRRLTGAGVPAFSEAFILADVRRDPGGASPTTPATCRAAISKRSRCCRPPVDRATTCGRSRRSSFRSSSRTAGSVALTCASRARRRASSTCRCSGGTAGCSSGSWRSTALRATVRSSRPPSDWGTFLIGVQASAGSSEVLERVERAGAAGFICFTQLNEGLVLLWQATRDERLLAAARTATDLLQPRRTQHSHGFLTTLRGALMLHEATGDAAPLARVERTMADLLASEDYLHDGGTHEFFGWAIQTTSRPSRRPARVRARTGATRGARWPIRCA